MQLESTEIGHITFSLEKRTRKVTFLHLLRTGDQSGNEQTFPIASIVIRKVSHT